MPWAGIYPALIVIVLYNLNMQTCPRWMHEVSNRYSEVTAVATTEDEGFALNSRPSRANPATGAMCLRRRSNQSRLPRRATNPISPALRSDWVCILITHGISHRSRTA